MVGGGPEIQHEINPWRTPVHMYVVRFLPEKLLVGFLRNMYRWERERG